MHLLFRFAACLALAGPSGASAQPQVDFSAPRHLAQLVSPASDIAPVPWDDAGTYRYYLANEGASMLVGPDLVDTLRIGGDGTTAGAAGLRRVRDYDDDGRDDVFTDRGVALLPEGRLVDLGALADSTVYDVVGIGNDAAAAFALVGVPLYPGATRVERHPLEQAPDRDPGVVVIDTFFNLGWIRASDVDGDGEEELVACGWYPQTRFATVLWTPVDSFLAGSVTNAILSGQYHAYEIIRLIDLDGDGDLDIVAPNQPRNDNDDRGGVFLVENLGGRFEEGGGRGGLLSQLPERQFGDVRSGDLNGDGLPDLALVEVHGDSISVAIALAREPFAYYGAGAYRRLATFPRSAADAWPSTTALWLYDEDGDGDLDLLFNYGGRDDLAAGAYLLSNLGSTTPTADGPTGAVARVEPVPNPATTTLTLRGLPESLLDASYILHDVAGRRVDRGRLRAGVLDVGKVPAGTYVLQIAASQTTPRYTVPFVVR